MKKNKNICIILLVVFCLINITACSNKTEKKDEVENQVAININKQKEFIENITKEEISNLKINDIIKYRLGNHTIVHRIVKIKEEKGEKVFITKGDNNNAVDQEVVHIDQVMGIVRFKIPKIGYPTVWLSEFFDKTRPDVET